MYLCTSNILTDQIFGMVDDGLGCNFEIDLKPIKNQIETQSRRKI